jgi:hypothetical protein
MSIDRYNIFAQSRPEHIRDSEGNSFSERIEIRSNAISVNKLLMIQVKTKRSPLLRGVQGCVY